MVDEMCKFSARSASIQGKNVQSVCDKISWCVALLALLRRERFCIGCKGGRAAAFLVAPKKNIIFGDLGRLVCILRVELAKC